MSDIVACLAFLQLHPYRERTLLQKEASDPYCTQQHAWAAIHERPRVLELLQLLAAGGAYRC